MTHRSSSGSWRTPSDGAPGRRRTPRRLLAGSAFAAVALVTVLAGLEATAAPAPAPAEAAPGAVVLDRTALQQALPALPDSVLPAEAGITQSVQPPSGQVKPAVVPAPGEQIPAAPIAELRRARAAFEAAAGKVSAPVPPPGPGMPEPAMPDFTGVARGSALGELQARFHEFQHNDWVLSGSVKAIGTEKVEVFLMDRVPTHRFSSCMDSSAIQIKDTSGALVLPAAPAGKRSATNIYDIQQLGGKWVVVAHSFPDVAAC